MQKTSNPAPPQQTGPSQANQPKPTVTGPSQGLSQSPQPSQGQKVQSPQAGPGPQPIATAGAQNHLRQALQTQFPGEFPVVLSNDEFTVSKVFNASSQGLRFKMERTKTGIKTYFILISKKGGLLKPSFLVSDSKFDAKEYDVMNMITGKSFLSIKENLKAGTWDIINKETGQKNVIGAVKIKQNGETRSVEYSQNSMELGKIDFKCPVQKSGMCSSHKPSNLCNIAVAGKFKYLSLEENPNGELCKDDLEINAYYPTAPDVNEFISLIALLQVMSHELH